MFFSLPRGFFVFSTSRCQGKKKNRLETKFVRRTPLRESSYLARFYALTHTWVSLKDVTGRARTHETPIPSRDIYGKQERKISVSDTRPRSPQTGFLGVSPRTLTRLEGWKYCFTFVKCFLHYIRSTLDG